MTDKPKIMVVDDSATILNAANDFLKEDYTVILVDNGFNALAAVNDVHPDLLFMDVMMPKLGGLDTCRLIKNNPDFEKLPIIILSGQGSPFDKARGDIVGCDDYLVKPFEKKVLLDVIKKHLG